MAVPHVATRDKLALSYGLCSGVCLLILASSEELVIDFGLGGFLITLLCLLAGAVILIWLAIALAKHLVARRWRRIASILCGPPLALVLVVMLTRAGIDLTWLRFEASKSDYLAQLERLPRNEPRMTYWRWGNTGLAVTASSDFTLVFDESDEIAAPSQRRSAAWTRRSNQAGLSDILQDEYLGAIRPLADHFYLVRQDFP